MEGCTAHWFMGVISLWCQTGAPSRGSPSPGRWERNPPPWEQIVKSREPLQVMVMQENWQESVSGLVGHVTQKVCQTVLKINLMYSSPLRGENPDFPWIYQVAENNCLGWKTQCEEQYEYKMSICDAPFFNISEKDTHCIADTPFTNRLATRIWTWRSTHSLFCTNVNICKPYLFFFFFFGHLNASKRLL